MLSRFLLVILTAFLCAGSSTAQTYKPERYFVSFTNKKHTLYSLDKPEAFLSSRALARRAKTKVGVDSLDLPVNRFYLDSILAMGAEIYLSSKWLNGAVFSVDSGTDISIFTQPHFVNSIDTVRYEYIPDSFHVKSGVQGYDIKNSLYSPVQANTGVEYGYSESQLAIMNLPPLHDDGFDGKGIHIAVLDAGFYNVDRMQVFSHLFNSNRVVAMQDFVDGDQNVFHGSSHGQLVLSVMAAWYPGIFVGAAPGASYLLLRSEDTGSEYPVEEINWAVAAEYADSAGADIINSSLGYTTFNYPALDHSYQDLDGNTAYASRAADIAAAKGMLVVNSAGNEGESSWFRIGVPADGDSVLAVGAVDQHGRYAGFSSKGPAFDGDVKPNVAAVGKDTWFVTYNEQIGAGNGTSFAAPLVAGAAACLWQAFPELTNMEIFDLIQKSSSQYVNPDSLMGYGIPDFGLAAIIQRQNELKNSDADAVVVPNPFGDHFFMVTDLKLQDPVFEIYDMNGRLVKRYSTVSKSPNGLYRVSGLHHLKQGIYLLRVSTSNTAFVVKLAKTF